MRENLWTSTCGRTKCKLYDLRCILHTLMPKDIERLTYVAFYRAEYCRKLPHERVQFGIEVNHLLLPHVFDAM